MFEWFRRLFPKRETPATMADYYRIMAEVNTRAAIEDNLMREWFEANRHRFPVAPPMQVHTAGPWIFDAHRPTHEQLLECVAWTAERMPRRET